MEGEKSVWIVGRFALIGHTSCGSGCFALIWALRAVGVTGFHFDDLVTIFVLFTTEVLSEAIKLLSMRLISSKSERSAFDSSEVM